MPNQYMISLIIFFGAIIYTLSITYVLKSFFDTNSNEITTSIRMFRILLIIAITSVVCSKLTLQFQNKSQTNNKITQTSQKLEPNTTKP